jgi:NTE family protein
MPGGSIALAAAPRPAPLASPAALFGTAATALHALVIRRELPGDELLPKAGPTSSTGRSTRRSRRCGPGSPGSVSIAVASTATPAPVSVDDRRWRSSEIDRRRVGTRATRWRAEVGSFVEISMERRRVAIACQGGGSHTAFTAGVLTRLLRDDEIARYDVVGLSGTSGGAICALLAWYALAGPGRVPAGELLDAFWSDNSATSPHEQVLNSWTVWAGALQNVVSMPAVSPYLNPLASAGPAELRRMLEARVDFDALPDADRGPMLLIGAVDVLSGDFKAFNSRREQISAEMILASAAIPTLFPSLHLDGGTYWDGLFSQNPPVRELVDARPDEIWVIQINPKRVDSEPRSPIEIADRRNELSGNLSLHQELRFIEKIDQLLEEGALARDGKYRTIVVRVIELSRARLSGALGVVSKLNRDPSFITGLIAHGEERAEEFLAALAFERAWRAGDVEATLSFFSHEARLASEAPFPEREPITGAPAIRRFLRDHPTRDVTIDVTHKQIAGDRVTWSARWQPRASTERVRGEMTATFHDGQITNLTLAGTP